MATHSSILAWRIPWTEEPGGVTKSRTQLKQLGMSISSYWEIQSEAIVRYHLLTVVMVIIKKTSDNKSWSGCGQRERLCNVGGIVRWHCHYEKQYRSSSKN